MPVTPIVVVGLGGTGPSVSPNSFRAVAERRTLPQPFGLVHGFHHPLFADIASVSG